MAGSVRQKKVVSELYGNVGKTSVGKAMRNAGYSKGYADNPQRLTHTVGWQELVNTLIPDDKLLKRLNRTLNNKNDFIAIKGIDVALKIKGRYTPTKVQLEDPYEDLSDEELDAMLHKWEKLRHKS